MLNEDDLLKVERVLTELYPCIIETNIDDIEMEDDYFLLPYISVDDRKETYDLDNNVLNELVITELEFIGVFIDDISINRVDSYSDGTSTYKMEFVLS